MDIHSENRNGNEQKLPESKLLVSTRGKKVTKKLVWPNTGRSLPEKLQIYKT